VNPKQKKKKTALRPEAVREAAYKKPAHRFARTLGPQERAEEERRSRGGHKGEKGARKGGEAQMRIVISHHKGREGNRALKESKREKERGVC